MQKELLRANPSLKLKVYVVWFSMIPTDSRSGWSWTGGIIEDSRVAHYWDEKKKVGRFFAGKDPESPDPDVVWDAYYLYGPDAQWLTKPEPLLGTGVTVLDEFDKLKSELAMQTVSLRWTNGILERHANYSLLYTARKPTLCVTDIATPNDFPGARNGGPEVVACCLARRFSAQGDLLAALA